jgi:MFS family permease
MPYFITLYTGLQYDYEAGQPVGVDRAAFGLPSSTKALITSNLSCGTFLGAVIAGDIADLIGRRSSIIIGCLVFTVGCILEMISTNQLALFVLGRLVSGVGVGFISATIILYMAEVAPRKVRGALISAYQFFITLGILLAHCVVYVTANRNDTGSYRIPIGVQFLWALVLGVGLVILRRLTQSPRMHRPQGLSWCQSVAESPRFHVMKGELDAAAHALSLLRGQTLDSDYTKDELAEIVASHEYEMQIVPRTSWVGSWMACFQGRLRKGNCNLRRTLLGAGLQMMQQLTG